MGRKVAPNNTLCDGRAPPNNILFDGAVPPNSTLFGGTPDSDEQSSQLLVHGRETVPTSKVCKRKFKIPAGIPVNSFFRFQPEPESSMKFPVPV